MTKSALLRDQLQSQLGARISDPFTFREFHVAEMAPSGVPEIDALTEAVMFPRSTDHSIFSSAHAGTHANAGGIPRGALTEIVGAASSGRTSLLVSLLAQATAREEVCALIDASDAFDPQAALSAGVELEKLLWIRCAARDEVEPEDYEPSRRRPGRDAQNRAGLEKALKAADLLLAGGGFSVVAIDLSDVPPQLARRVPLAHWFRFCRAVEKTPTALVVLEQFPYAKTCASLVLRFEVRNIFWSQAAEVDQEFGARDCGPGLLLNPPLPAPGQALHACLLRGARLEVEILRSRRQHAAVKSTRTSFEISAA